VFTFTLPSFTPSADVQRGNFKRRDTGGIGAVASITPSAIQHLAESERFAPRSSQPSIPSVKLGLGAHGAEQIGYPATLELINIAQQ